MNSNAKFIKKYGTSVEVSRLLISTPTSVQTKAILGRNTRTNTNLISLESQKEGVFSPEIDIDSGDFVKNLVTGESFVVSSTLPEMHKNVVISTVASLFKCNHTMTVRTMGMVADARGNLKPGFNETYKDIPCYVRQVANDLKQFDSGLHPETEYMVYTTALTIKEEDKVVIAIRGVAEEFKVTAKDYVTFPNMLVLQICRDVRK